jgi:hypothetical protein
MVWAFYDSISTDDFHGKNAGSFYVNFPSTGGCIYEGPLKRPRATLHGVIMWFAWTVIALMQMGTGRYLKHYWKIRQTLHTALGLTSLVLTIVGFFIILREAHWTLIIKAWHNITGVIFFFLCILLCLGGCYALYLRRYANMDWKTKAMLRMIGVHKYFGYFIIFTV